ncbi:MAG: hypothetical protein LBP22_02360 [Deltaproteobacteria bacterium]|nr:hypothetical protein [Deltaproteobacteria bacterium]
MTTKITAYTMGDYTEAELGRALMKSKSPAFVIPPKLKEFQMSRMVKKQR